MFYGLRARTITNNVLDGIFMYFSDDNDIIDNTIRDNGRHGIHLGQNCNGNIIVDNTIENNNNHGLLVFYTSGNTIYHNDFLNDNAGLSGTSTNTWDDGYLYGGNYWSAHSSSDFFYGKFQNKTGRDAIGDTPYIIDENNIDNYPLMRPWGIYYDVTGDNYVGVDDVVAVAEHFGMSPSHPDWNPLYNIDKSGYVGIDNIIAVAEHFGESC